MVVASLDRKEAAAKIGFASAALSLPLRDLVTFCGGGLTRRRFRSGHFLCSVSRVINILDSTTKWYHNTMKVVSANRSLVVTICSYDSGVILKACQEHQKISE